MFYLTYCLLFAIRKMHCMSITQFISSRVCVDRSYWIIETNFT